jgi:hypothetical protein
VVDSFGNIVQKRDIADEFFVEGITIHNGRLFVSTWACPRRSNCLL